MSDESEFEFPNVKDHIMDQIHVHFYLTFFGICEKFLLFKYNDYNEEKKIQIVNAYKKIYKQALTEALEEYDIFYIGSIPEIPDKSE